MGSESLSEEHWIGLHELRLRGVLVLGDRSDRSDPSGASGTSGMSGRSGVFELGEVAAVLEAAGYAARRGEKLVATPAGRAAHGDWARLEPGTAECAAAEEAYATFVPLNRELLRLCHDWQVRAGSANTHDDPTHDWAVIDRLRDLDERVGPVARRLGRLVARFGPYRPGLRDARRRVEAGESEWFASPRCDSYHTVWMRLHEDLLCATGAERSAEPAVEEH